MKVLTNGHFISCDDENSCFSVMVIDHDKIVYTGDTVPESYSECPTVDMHGHTIVPAFSDTHMHFESFALFRTTVDVRDAKNFEEMGQMLRAWTNAHPKAKFLPAYGCSAHTVEEKRLPEMKDLDAMTELPLLIVKYDGHAAVANSALIDLFPLEVLSDPGFDSSTGWLYQNAFYKGVNFITQKVSPITLLQGMQEAADTLAEKGIGYIHTVEGVGYKNDIDIDTINIVRKGLPQKFTVFFQTMDVDKVVKRKMTHIGGCFSLALDGCFGSEDAALSEGYTNNPENKGFLAYSQEEVNDFCIKANRAGLQITMHAIGDAAVEQALNAYEAALKDYPRKDARHILIHGDLMNKEAIEKAAKLGITVAVQPAFLDWPQEPEVYLESILGERAKQILPLRDMIDAGLLVTSGSDAPCTIPDPIEGIHICCNHPNPEQALTPIEALKTYTIWSARSAFDDNYYGSLEAGKKANFLILDKDILSIPKEEIKTTKIKGVFLNGRRFRPSEKFSIPGIALDIWKHRKED